MADAVRAAPSARPRAAVPIPLPRALAPAAGLAWRARRRAALRGAQARAGRARDDHRPGRDGPRRPRRRQGLPEAGPGRRSMSDDTKAAIEEFNKLVDDIANKRLDRTEAFRRMEALEHKLLTGSEADKKALEAAAREHRRGDEEVRPHQARRRGARATGSSTRRATRCTISPRSCASRAAQIDKAKLEQMRAGPQEGGGGRRAAQAAGSSSGARSSPTRSSSARRRRATAAVRRGAEPAREEAARARAPRPRARRAEERRPPARPARPRAREGRRGPDEGPGPERRGSRPGRRGHQPHAAAARCPRRRRRSCKQKLQELRELMRQQGQGGKGQIVRLKRFGRMARGQGGQGGREGGQQGQGRAGPGRQGAGRPGRRQGQGGQGQNGQRPGRPERAGPGRPGRAGRPGRRDVDPRPQRREDAHAVEGPGRPAQGRAAGRAARAATGQGQPRHGWGEGHDPNVQGRATNPKMGTQDTQVQGADTGQGGSRSQVILGAAERGFASRGYKKVYTEYHQVAEESLAKDDDPRRLPLLREALLPAHSPARREVHERARDADVREPEAVREQVTTFTQRIDELRAEIAKSIVGNREVVDGVITCMLAGGHALLEGVPGPRQDDARAHDGRDAVAHVLAHPVHARPDAGRHPRHDGHRRDAGGRQGRSSFRKGPIFANIVLADEINRATPEDAERAARGDAGAPRDRRQAHLRARRAVRRARDAEPARDGGHLPACPRRSSTASSSSSTCPSRAARSSTRSSIGPPARRSPKRARACSTASAILQMQQLVREVPVARHVQDYAVRVLQATHPDGPDAPRPREALRALRQLAARGAGASSSPPRSARSSTGASPPASTTCAPSAHPGAPPPRAPQLRGRGRGHQDRPGHRRDPQGACPRRPRREKTAAAPPEPTERFDGPARRSCPGVASKSAAPAEDDGSLRRRVPAQARVPRAGQPPRLRRAAARRAAHQEERQRRRVRRPPRLPAGRRLPLPRLERLPALRAAPRAPLRGGGGPRHLLHPRHQRVDGFGDGEQAPLREEGRARRSPTWASRTSTA